MDYMQVVKVYSKVCTFVQKCCKSLQSQILCHTATPFPLSPDVKSGRHVPPWMLLWLKYSFVYSTFLHKPTLWIWICACSYNVQSIHHSQQISTKTVVISSHTSYHKLLPPKKKCCEATAPSLCRDRRPWYNSYVSRHETLPLAM